MNTIPISQIVEVNPRVVGAGGAQGSLDGLLLTTNAGVPTGELLVFSTAAEVGTYFGPTSDEYLAAQVYFGGIIGGGQQPGSLTFARYADAALPATVYGVNPGLTLTQLKALTGTLILTTAAPHTSSSINLSAATSFADAAAIMQAAFTTPDFDITYDAQRGRFVVTTDATGNAATVSAVTGTLATGVGLSAAAGASLQSPGLAEDTPSSGMDRVRDMSGNWGVFSTVWEPDIIDRTGFAVWNSAQDFQFIYAAWDTDVSGLANDNPISFGNLVMATPYQGTLPVYGDLLKAAGVLAWAASTNYLMTEGRNTLAFRQLVTGEPADVSNLADANALLSNGYTYYGAYASAANNYALYYNGAIGGQFLWADTFLNQIWLRRTLQQALFETLLAYKSLPYNAEGYAAVYQGCMDTVSQAVANGVIRSGVTLSPSQQAQINTQAGVAIAEQVSSLGWYLQVTDPLSTTVRSERGSPVVNFWYCDGGSIQKIVVSSTTIL